MKTNLPVTRNRNLPPPPAVAASVQPRPLAPGEVEPRRGIMALRSFSAMLLVGGMLAALFWMYIRNAEPDTKARENVQIALMGVGLQVWETGMSPQLTADNEETTADLADLPRVAMAVRGTAGKVRPEIRVIEGDPPPGKGTGSHQILFLLNEKTILVVRVFYEKDTGAFKFLGEANRIVPSRKELKEPPASPATATPAVPEGVAPATASPAPPANIPAAPAAPGEKVSGPP